jgi:uncharacterized membrane protein YfcA
MQQPMRILRALQKSRTQDARREIIKHAHLLPKTVKLEDLLNFPPSGQAHLDDASARSHRQLFKGVLPDEHVGAKAVHKPVLKTGALLGIILGVIATIFLLREIGLIPPIDFTLALKVVAMFVGALVAGVAGFAFSAVSGAILLHWVPPTTAVPLLLACSITSQLMSITKLWHTMRWRQCAPFLIGGIVGIPAGAKLLEDLDARIFACAFGVFLVCYGAYTLLGPKIAVPRGSRLVDVAAGLAGGITGGSFAFPGAIPTIWCNIRGLAKHEQRGIVQPFIFLMQIATLLYFSKFGMIASGLTTTYLLCAPVVLGGTWLGLHLFDNIDDAMFRRLVLIFLVISGIFLVL